MMYLRTPEEVNQMLGTMERTLRDQRVAAARIHNTGLLARAAEVWFSSVAEDASAPEIQERMLALGSFRCESPACGRTDRHARHN